MPSNVFTIKATGNGGSECCGFTETEDIIVKCDGYLRVRGDCYGDNVRSCIITTFAATFVDSTEFVNTRREARTNLGKCTRASSSPGGSACFAALEANLIAIKSARRRSRKGNNTVFTNVGTVSNDHKAELAGAHGCAHPIVYTREDFVGRVKEITEGAGVPVVFDSVGRDTFLGSLDCLRPRGLLVSFGQASGPVAPFDIGLLNQKGALYLTRPSLMWYTQDRAELMQSAQALFAVVGSGAVRVEINQSVPLSEAAQAHRALEARETAGSSVLLPD